jgi:pimeloyl-ACP methyl ester carboxylesterase
VYPFFRLLRYLPRVHNSYLAAGVAPFWALLPLSWRKIVLNPKNVEPLLVKRAICHLISDISRGEILQFAQCAENGKFTTYDGKYSYDENFERIRRPLLLMAGTRDSLCSPESVRDVYKKISSRRKALHVLGKEYGTAEEYGHGDLLIGVRAETEVFARILEWLESSDQATESEGGRRPEPEALQRRGS